MVCKIACTPFLWLKFSNCCVIIFVTVISNFEIEINFMKPAVISGFYFLRNYIMTRHELREFAFVLLFEQAVTKGNMKEIINCAEELREVEVEDFAITLVNGVEENNEKIDEVIDKYSHGWKVDRLSKVSAATLRLATYELLFQKGLPIGVSINEAVEIAKKYGDKDDPNYVNGVLSSISKDKELMGEKLNIEAK